MTEQAAARRAGRARVVAEEAGFDFAVISDHYFPWLDEMGHSPYAWRCSAPPRRPPSRIPLMTYVTCPTDPLPPGRRRAEGRDPADRSPRAGSPSGWARARTSTSTWSAAAGRPPTSARRCSTRRSRSSASCSAARLHQLPRRALRRGVGQAVGPAREAGPDRRRRLRQAVLRGSPAELRRRHDRHRAEAGAGASGSTRPAARASRASASCRSAYGTDRDAAVTRAHRLFRWFGLRLEGQRRAARPGRPSRRAASSSARRTSPRSIPCGDDVDAVLEAAKEYAEAGFTHLALVQIGGDQQAPFIAWAEKKLLPALRRL